MGEKVTRLLYALCGAATASAAIVLWAEWPTLLTRISDRKRGW